MVVATVRMSGVIEKSTVVMQSMSRLINVAEISATMRDLSKEMMKVSIRSLTSALSIRLGAVTFYFHSNTSIIYFIKSYSSKSKSTGLSKSASTFELLLHL